MSFFVSCKAGVCVWANLITLKQLLKNTGHFLTARGIKKSISWKIFVFPGHLLSEHEVQLRDKTNEILELKKEAEFYRNESSNLREQLSCEKKNDENRIMMLKEANTKQRLQFEKSAEVLYYLWQWQIYQILPVYNIY